jgi:hypothetical protein
VIHADDRNQTFLSYDSNANDSRSNNHQSHFLPSLSPPARRLEIINKLNE